MFDSIVSTNKWPGYSRIKNLYIVGNLEPEKLIENKAEILNKPDEINNVDS